MSVPKEVFVFGPPCSGNRLIRRLFRARNVACSIYHPHLRMHSKPPKLNKRPGHETYIIRTHRDEGVWYTAWGGNPNVKKPWVLEDFHDLADIWCRMLGIEPLHVHYEDVVRAPVKYGRAICKHTGLAGGKTVQDIWGVKRIYDANKKHLGGVDHNDPACVDK